MRVRADDGRRAPVDEIAERLLLARRLGVEVDDDRVGPVLQPARADLGVDRAERAVELGHEDAAHGVDDQHLGAGRGLEHGGAAPRRAFGIVDGTDEPLVALDENERLLLIEGVVAQRDDVGAGLQQIHEDRFRDAEAARRVLAVDDDEVEGEAPAQAGQRVDDRLAARSADDVAEKQKTHSRS